MSAAIEAPDGDPIDPATDAVGSVREIIEDYVARSYECLAQIEMAKRQLAEVRQNVSQALQPISGALTTTERNEVFADFYWDAVDLPSEPIVLGLGQISIQKTLKEMRPGPTGVPCRGCGSELFAYSRTDFRQIKATAENPNPKRRTALLSSDLLCVQCRAVEAEARDRRWEQSRSHQRDAWRQRQAELRSMPYPAYLRSPEWQQTKAAALKRSRYRCQLCGANQWVTLDVHHNTYERRGAELPADLIVLCRSCHTNHHTRLPTTDDA